MGDKTRKNHQPRRATRPLKPTCINVNANSTQLRKDNTTLKTLYLNADNSLRCKLTQLKYEVALEDPEFIFVTEVKPKNGSPTCKELLEINEYNLHLNPAYTEDGTRGNAHHGIEGVVAARDSPGLGAADGGAGC